MFFKKRKKPSDFVPLTSAEEAKPLGSNVPRPLTFEGEPYTVLDEMIHGNRLFLICTGKRTGGQMTILQSDGDDASCRGVDAALAKEVFNHYLLQPK